MASNASPPQDAGLTRYVADFVCRTRLQDLPQNVVALGKKSILDGLGLALSGGATPLGAMVKQHFADLHLGAGPSTVIGSNLKVAPRFAAFANGVGIHADDYDDTQLAVAPDRVYGLLTHPTAPVLAATLALAERLDASGADLLAAYLVGIEIATKTAEAAAKVPQLPVEWKPAW